MGQVPASDTEPLPVLSVAGRVERLREHLAAAGHPPSFVATAPADVRWLTGFHGSAGSVVVTDDSFRLITDTRYGERAETELAEAGADAEVDALTTDGLADHFIHGLGHGVGLVIHEPPFLTYSDEPLVAGQVITIEPGVYLPGRGGVRWEDLLVVTEDGHDVLTHSPKEPDPGRF